MIKESFTENNKLNILYLSTEYSKKTDTKYHDQDPISKLYNPKLSKNDKHSYWSHFAVNALQMHSAIIQIVAT